MRNVMDKVTILCGDVRDELAKLPDNYFDCVVTSPPYWGLRDYGTGRWDGGDIECEHVLINGDRTPWANKLPGPNGRVKNTTASRERAKTTGGHCTKCGAARVDDQLGLEQSLGEHLQVMVDVFREVRRVLKPTGTVWLNYGDCYAASPNGRSAADTKAVGNDDRTFRDKPFSTIGAIYDPEGGGKGKGGGAGKNRYKDDRAAQAGRVVGLGRLAKWDRKSERNGHNFGAADGSVADVRVMPAGYLKPKDLCMVPNRLAIALQDDGWWVRSEIIWHKPNPMPESTTDRPTTSHEKIWLLTKRERYFYDADAIAEPVTGSTIDRVSQPTWDQQAGSSRAVGKTNGNMKAVVKRSGNKERKFGDDAGRPGHAVGRSIPWEGSTRNSRNVWTIGTEPFSEAHFAVFPSALAERCIRAGSPAGGSILDPFGGAGTTGLAAVTLGRSCTLIELNPEYCALARARIEAAFMGKDEGARHMTKNLRKTEPPGPLFSITAE